MKKILFIMFAVMASSMASAQEQEEVVIENYLNIELANGTILKYNTKKIKELTWSTYSSKDNVVYTVNDVKFSMVPVKGGTFSMGANVSTGGTASSPIHDVTLDDYFIGETEVTQALWIAVMGSNPSSNKKGGNYPVENVSWNACQEFISKLNEALGLTNAESRFRLPTEAEWEFAARGGYYSNYSYSGSNTLGDVAWYSGNSSSTHEVKGKLSNELGLYDMSGNVCEWCSDWFGSYSSSAQTNPTGPSTGSFRVFRGGGIMGNLGYCHVAQRNYRGPSDSAAHQGLRLVFK